MDERGSQKVIEIEERASSVPVALEIPGAILGSDLIAGIPCVHGVHSTEYFACRRYVSQRVGCCGWAKGLCRRDSGDSITRGGGDLEIRWVQV